MMVTMRNSPIASYAYYSRSKQSTYPEISSIEKTLFPSNKTPHLFQFISSFLKTPSSLCEYLYIPSSSHSRLIFYKILSKISFQNFNPKNGFFFYPHLSNHS